MVEISDRVGGLTAGGDDGWGVYNRARLLEAEGRRITDLTIGEHDVRTDPEILTAMEAAARGGHTGYAALSGTPALRDAIAARVAGRTGVPTTRANVLVTPGGQSALFAAMVTSCDPGADILFPDPYYATYPGTARAASARPVPVATRPADGFRPRRADFAAAATPATRALLVNTPNNPSGVVYDESDLDVLAGFASDHDLWLISDEVYDTQLWSGRHLSPRTLPGMAARTLVVGSMSKSHAMTGSRIGWLIGPEAAIARAVDLSTHTTYGVAGFIQDAALHALSLGPDFEARIAEPFRRRRAACLARLEGERAVGVLPSGGGMYLMLDIRASGLSGTDFALRLLEERHIAVMPGESFGRAAAGHLRLALTRPDAELATALDTLIAFARELAA